MEIRSLDPADLEAALDVRTRSFGRLSGAAQQSWRQLMQRALASELVLGCYQGSVLAAVARINNFHQWWGGRSLPMAGVAGVVVAPEYRGQGVGRQLVLATLDRVATRGFPLSALYPATVGVYRRCGWEFGGAQQWVSMPAEALRELRTDRVPLHRVGPADAEEILSVVRAVHAGNGSSGPIDWSTPEVASWLAEEEPFAYLAPDGFLAYHWDGSDLEVDELIAGSHRTIRALWSVVGSGSSIAKTVRACLGPDDPLRWLTRESVVQPVRENRWMLRLVDVAAALSQRGYPAGVRAEVTFVVDDPHLRSNAGGWRLTVADGQGKPERVPTPADAVTLPAGAMAALYAGAPLPSLRAAGLVSGGDPAHDGLLSSVFAGRPYLLDYF